jgi:hypothetical protein
MTESDTCGPSALRVLDNVNMSCTLCNGLYKPNSDPIPSEEDDPSIFDLTTSAQNGCKGCFLLSQAARAFEHSGPTSKMTKCVSSFVQQADQQFGVQMANFT